MRGDEWITRIEALTLHRISAVAIQCPQFSCCSCFVNRTAQSNEMLTRKKKVGNEMFSVFLCFHDVFLLFTKGWRSGIWKVKIEKERANLCSFSISRSVIAGFYVQWNIDSVNITSSSDLTSYFCTNMICFKNPRRDMIFISLKGSTIHHRIPRRQVRKQAQTHIRSDFSRAFTAEICSDCAQPGALIHAFSIAYHIST